MAHLYIMCIHCDNQWGNQASLFVACPPTTITNPHLKQPSEDICGQKTEVLAIVVVMDFHRISRQQWCKQIHLKPADSTLRWIFCCSGQTDMWNYGSWLVVSQCPAVLQEWQVEFHMCGPLYVVSGPISPHEVLGDQLPWLLWMAPMMPVSYVFLSDPSESFGYLNLRLPLLV